MIETKGELKALTYEENVALLEKNKVNVLPNFIVVPVPILEKRTKGGIWKPETALSNDETNEKYSQWHRVLVSTVTGIEVGDSVMLSPKDFDGAKISVEGTPYHVAAAYTVRAISKGGIAVADTPVKKEETNGSNAKGN